jgi:ABC-type molybdate transport system substrate-binding protein
MRRILSTLIGGAVAVALVAGCATSEAPKPASAAPAPAAAAPPAVARFATIPPKKDTDLKLYIADGRVVQGAEALGRMQAEADVVLWLAGNQFFAMDDVVKAFQKKAPGTRVGLITLPPGLLLEAIEKGGWVYGGKEYPGRPDVYASVNLNHLARLKKQGLMDTYFIYLHNEMELMVAVGNPKGIKGVKDLARADVRTSMPNPVNEGIMQFYGRKVLQRHGLWEHISGGKECFSCQTTPTNWFTAVHHRETPERILAGTSDTGFVWVTETREAKRNGAKVDSVKLPPEDSLRNEVSYAIGALTDSRRKAAAQRYLAFLASPAAQQAYGSFGFVAASAEELKPRPIP